MPDLAGLQSFLVSIGVGVTGESLAALAVLLLAIFLMWLALAWIGGDKQIALRPIAGYTRLRRLIAEAAERGQPIHLAPGTGSLGDSGTAETLAGVTAAYAVARRAAAAQTPLVMTTANPVVLPVLENAAERAYSAAGVAQEYQPDQVRFAGPNRAAYALHVADILVHERAAANVLLGSFGDEFLLISEPAGRAGVEQVAGTANPLTLPFVVTSTEYPVLGEEVFAAGAYLAGRRSHLASLLAQDWLRLLAAAAIIAGVVLKTVGG